MCVGQAAASESDVEITLFSSLEYGLHYELVWEEEDQLVMPGPMCPEHQRTRASRRRDRHAVGIMAARREALTSHNPEANV